MTQWGGTAFAYPLTEEQLRTHFETADEKPTRIGYKAVDPGVQDASSARSSASREDTDGGMVGSLELNRVDREHDSAAISRVVVDPAERNRGVGAAMVREVLAVGFEEFNLHRIELRVFEDNDTAIACYESVGFVREGVHRDSHRCDGEYLSTVQMSILEDEWRRTTGEG